MDTLSFLRSVWPSEGYYLIALFHRKGERTWWEQESFTDVEAAARFALARGKTQDAYFAIHSLREAKVWNPTKVIGDKVGGWTYRTHANMLVSRTFFGDGDVGPDKPYTTLAEVVLGLKAFCLKTGLPKPTMVKSGRGLHIYWRLTRALPSLIWREHAVKLKQLCASAGFHLDPSRITDQASVLRVPGTFHLKDPANPLPVVVLHDGGEVDTDEFLALLDRGTLFTPLPGEFAKGEAPEGWGSKPPPIVDLGHACALVRYAFRNPHEVNEPQWYQLLGLVRHVEDGPAWCHKMSKGHPDYDQGETDAKIHQLNTAAGGKLGPTTCGKMAEVFGEDTCAKCWYAGHPTSSPLAASRRLPKKSENVGIPDPPAPWSRLKEGGILYSPADGTTPRVVCEYDIYPTAIIHDEHRKRREVEWVIEIPHKGSQRFTTSATVVYDGKLMQELIAHAGLFTEFDNLKYIRQYMSAYIKLLQRHVSESQQHTHLGWTPDYGSFVMPDLVYTRERNYPAAVNSEVLNASQYIHRKGTMKRQVELLQFYNKPEYVRQQFFMLCSLASVLFHATGNYGALVNLSGLPGASKSSSLYTAAGFWGDPIGFTINGLAEGQTVRARQSTIALLHNLPVPVDEITMIPRDDARALAMSITQPQALKAKLERDGRLKKLPPSQKSTIMMTTSNNSLQELMSGANATGTASSMRLVEIEAPIVEVDTKRTADDYLREMKLHFGHIGPAFLDYLMRHKEECVAMVVEAIREIDQAVEFKGAERFWSSVMGCTLAALRIAYKLGLVPYNPTAVEAWLLQEQLRQMRGVVSTNYSDPLDTMMAYISAIAGDLLVVKQGGTTVLRAPRGDLIGRFEADTRILYVGISHLKTYCLRHGIPMHQTLGVLDRMGVTSRTRMVLGRGVAQWSMGQVQTVQLNLGHVAVLGRPEVVEIESNVVSLRR